MRTIKEVLNIKTGEFINAEDFFSLPESTVFIQRRELEEYNQKKEKFLVCPFCHQAVKIRGNKEGKLSLHFSHLYDSGDCILKTTNKYTKDEIQRMKYNGQKESERHKKLKHFIADFIEKDSNFSDIKVEKNYNSKGVSKEWKRPDVSAKFKDLDIVFEIQLSTTFLSVIVEREVFYKENKTYIIWFFNNFTTDIKSQKFTEKDIFYLNKNNAFVINEKTIKLSEEQNTLIFLCYYQEPFIDNNNNIVKEWKSKYICFDQLEFDHDNYKLFYYDTERKEKELNYALYLKSQDKLRKEEELRIYNFQKFQDQLRNEFEYFWINKKKLSEEEMNSKLLDFKNKFESQNIKFSLSDKKLEAVLNGIYSLKYKKIINYNFRKLIELGNFILEQCKDVPEYIEVFLLALRFYNFEDMILQEDKKGTFRKKVENYKSSNFTNYKQINNLFKILFPELKY